MRFWRSGRRNGCGQSRAAAEMSYLCGHGLPPKRKLIWQVGDRVAVMASSREGQAMGQKARSVSSFAEGKHSCDDRTQGWGTEHLVQQ